ERFKFFRDDPASLRSLVVAGAWLQVTVDSLLGNHGEMPRAFGKQVLAEYPDAVLATDTHNLDRCSGLSAGYAWVSEKLGAERAMDLRARSNHILKTLLGTSAP